MFEHSYFIPVAKATAPPDPPSPIMKEKIGDLTFIEQRIELAIASDCPLSSASTPGCAPGVSTNVTTGRLNLLQDYKVFALFYNLQVLPYQNYF